MELRHLRYFVAIAEEENFHRAAAKLHVSQSPLSRQMQQLREELGVDLFTPSGRGVKLTLAGRAFLERARASSPPRTRRCVRPERRWRGASGRSLSASSQALGISAVSQPSSPSSGGVSRVFK